MLQNCRLALCSQQSAPCPLPPTHPQNSGSATVFHSETIPNYTNHENFQKLADLLYEAAEEGGYVNPGKIREILGFTKEGTLTAKGEVYRFQFWNGHIPVLCG